METRVAPAEGENLALAVSILKGGGLVAFPTETVYGLGALASLPEAVAQIFAVKGRPADNPLIVHVACVEDAYNLWAKVSHEARRLMDAFWPGPLTLVAERAPGVPDIVTAGLSTVAVRCPEHPAGRALIEASGPIAAPSANPSGRPSPTTAAHVLRDLNSKIPLILDGGPCAVGLESTVLDVSGVPVLLRPGGVTREQIEDCIGRPISVSEGVCAPLGENDTARSPGMRHRHYAPLAKVTVVSGGAGAALREACRRYDAVLANGGKPLLLCFDGEDAAGRDARSMGATPREAAARLYALLRSADASGVTHIIARGAPEEGMGLALMNRLLRAADFDLVEVPR